MSESEARQVVEKFFTAFNANDVDGFRSCMNYPHIILTRGSVLISQEPSDFINPIPILKAQQNWDRSLVKLLEPIHVAEDKVHFKIVFNRYRSDGTKYTVLDGIWVITNQDGHWGVQCRSMIPRDPGMFEEFIDRYQDGQ